MTCGRTDVHKPHDIPQLSTSRHCSGKPISTNDDSVVTKPWCCVPCLGSCGCRCHLAAELFNSDQRLQEATIYAKKHIPGRADRTPRENTKADFLAGWDAAMAHSITWRSSSNG